MDNVTNSQSLLIHLARGFTAVARSRCDPRGNECIAAMNFMKDWQTWRESIHNAIANVTNTACLRKRANSGPLPLGTISLRISVPVPKKKHC